MSDEQLTVSNLPETITVDEQARTAGRRVGDLRHGVDDIDALSDTLKQFCDAQLPTSNALSTARTNFSQALYWLRTHRNEQRG